MTAIASDYAALTTGCGLLDRSERGKLALTGKDTKEFLNGQVSNDIVKLTPGNGLYAALLTPKGKMRGDLRVLDAEPELLLDTERPALQELFNTIRRFSIGYDVQLHKRTLQRALFSLIGPQTDQTLKAAGAEAPAGAEHCHAPATVAGHQVRLIRTDVGVDVLCDSDAAEELQAALTAAGAQPVAEQAAEIVRVEHGRPRYGIDVDDTVIPQEAGLNDRAVSFTKGCYVGQETVARLFYRGKPNRELRGLRCSEPLPAGSELRVGDKTVGKVSSPVQSPRLGPIALALLRRQAPVGTTVTAQLDGRAVEAEVVALPFSDVPG